MITFADAGGAPEALAEGAGIVVPYGNINAVAAELHRLTTDHTYYDKISKRAVQRVRMTYRFCDYAARIAELLSDECGVDFCVDDTGNATDCSLNHEDVENRGLSGWRKRTGLSNMPLRF